LVPKVPLSLLKILPSPIASGGDEFGACDVCFKAVQNSGAMAAYLLGFRAYL
jgi:hypothetical protein